MSDVAGEALAELSMSEFREKLEAIERQLAQVAELVEAIAAKQGIDLDAAEPSEKGEKWG